MSTLKKLKRYSDEQVDNAIKKGFVNGCGGKGGLNFSQVLKSILKNFDNYDFTKYESLFFDIERLCNEHDLDYHFKKGFRKSNFIFAKNIFKLVKSWSSFSERLFLFFIIYHLLNKYGKKYYYLP